MSGESLVSEAVEMEMPIANGGLPLNGSVPLTEKENNGVVDSATKEGASSGKEEGVTKVEKEAKEYVEEYKDVTNQVDISCDKQVKEEVGSMYLDKDSEEDKMEEETEKAAVEENSVLEEEDDNNKMNIETEGRKITEEEVNGLDKEPGKAEEIKEKNEEEKMEENKESGDMEMVEKRNETKVEENEKDKENDEEDMDEKSNGKMDEELEEKVEDGGTEGKAYDVNDDKADEVKPEEHKEEKGSKKGRSRKSASEKINGNKELKQEMEQRTPVTDRPVRERKSVERLVATVEKDSNREIHVETGRGTPLKDIPNVAYKMARRKSDSTFKLLHSVMFGKRVKAFQIKGNISRFSGFVWHDDEEKQRSKVKEKFDKCTKERLLEVCDILDIHDAKITTRKEDIVVKLIDFLVAPRATTTVVLAEKESGKGQKRKRGMRRISSTPRSGSSNQTAKNQSSDASKRGSKKANYHSDISEDEEEHETDEEKAVNGISEEFDHEMHDRSESGEESSSEDESEEDTGKKKKQNSSNRKQSAGKPKSSRKSSPQSKTPKRLSSSKRGKVDDDDDDDEASSTPRKKNESSISAKSASKMKTGKKTEKGKDKEKNEKAGPSTRKLRDAICEILKKVDFNTATFTDILKLLAKKFDTDLTPRKAAIKLMIQGELQKLADDADDDEEEAGEVVEKEEMAIDNTKVKA